MAFVEQPSVRGNLGGPGSRAHGCVSDLPQGGPRQGNRHLSSPGTSRLWLLVRRDCKGCCQDYRDEQCYDRLRHVSNLSPTASEAVALWNIVQTV